MFASIFEGSRSTNRVLYFIETAKIPIKYIFSKRLLMYYWHILSRPGTETIRKVYEVMKCKTVRQDWYLRLIDEKQRYNINLTDGSTENEQN